MKIKEEFMMEPVSEQAWPDVQDIMKLIDWFINIGYIKDRLIVITDDKTYKIWI